MLLLLFTTLMTFFYNGRSDLNVALNKEAFFCGNSTPSNKITDGIKSLDEAAVFRECIPCEVEIRLLRDYMIHYIVVYEGHALEEEKSRGLDYLQIEMKKKSHSFNLRCINLRQGIGAQENVGMRINCLVTSADTVKLKTEHNDGLSLAEVEVYTIDDIPKSDTLLGCYNLSKFESGWTLLTMGCIYYCRSTNHLFALLKGKSCKCRDSRIEHISDKKLCNSETCGKTCAAFAQVYLANVQLPVNIGCLVWNKSIEENVMRDKSTLFKCVDACKSHRYAAMTLNKCECVDEDYLEEDMIQSPFQCNMFYHGHNNSMSGKEGFASVYLVLAHETLAGYLDSKGCFDAEKYGVCSASCNAGYTGEKCGNSEIELEKLRSEITHGSLTWAEDNTQILDSSKKSVELEKLRSEITHGSLTWAENNTKLLDGSKKSAAVKTRFKSTKVPRSPIRTTGSRILSKSIKMESENKEHMTTRAGNFSISGIYRAKFITHTKKILRVIHKTPENYRHKISSTLGFSSSGIDITKFKTNVEEMQSGKISLQESLTIGNGFLYVASILPVIMAFIIIMIIRSSAPLPSDENGNDMKIYSKVEKKSSAPLPSKEEEGNNGADLED